MRYFWMISALLSLHTFLWCKPLQERGISVKSLKELASYLDLPSDADLVAETQKRWLRKSGQERWEVEEISPEKKKFVLDWAFREGIFSEWKPADTQYDVAIILGATTGRMEKRLSYLESLWKSGVRFQEVAWLTGERPLDPRVDDFTDVCQTETDAAKALWKSEKLLSHLPVRWISVPMKQELGKRIRPNTEDTLVAWLKEQATPCKALFLSDQPFCGYQHSIVEQCLPDEYLFDVVGEKVLEDPYNHPYSAAVVLDSVARWIFCEQQVAKIKKPNI